jgi:predicted  nucleic acid-binding Zn-ribbon protein
MEGQLKKQEKEHQQRMQAKDVEIEQMEAQVLNMEGELKRLNRALEKAQYDQLNKTNRDSKNGAGHVQKLEGKIEELKKKNAFLVRVAENSKGLVEKMGALKKDKSMLELQLSISQREKALALESIGP